MRNDIYPRHLAYYVDSCMRRGFKGCDEKQVDSVLDDIINLLKNLNSKDIFITNTENLMAIRLIKE